MLRKLRISLRQAIRTGAVLSLLLCGAWGPAVAQETGSQLKLAVVLVVDQMRADYLSRWSEMYSGGLHRLLENGAYFTNAYHDHAATVTATGHATIATGAVPARHGIVGNSFYDRCLGKVVHSVADSTTTRLGGRGGRGASPHLLLRSTIGDWLKQTSPHSRVFTASLKDRAAILMGGKTADGVFWYDSHTGDFVTSSFYTDILPEWVVSFNSSGTKEVWRDSLWTESRQISDAEIHFGKAAGGDTEAAFAHTISTSDDPADYYGDLYGSPFADVLLLEFGLDLLRSEQLGEGAATDLLMISLSATDAVGHQYGPDSREIMDHYLRLDTELGIFLDSLDARFGKDGYVLVLASDHGVAPVPETAAQEGLTGYHRVFVKDYRADVERVMRETFVDCDQAASLLTPIYNGFVIDTTIAAQCGLTRQQVETLAASAIEKLDYVANVFTFSQLSGDSDTDLPYSGLFRNSFSSDRALDLSVNFNEGVLLTSWSTGTSHGAPYRYDTHVPIVFYGDDIRSMVSSDSVRSVDIATTLAAILNVTPEPGVDGEVLPVTSKTR